MIALLALFACNPEANLEPDTPTAGLQTEHGTANTGAVANPNAKSLAGARPIITTPPRPLPPRPPSAQKRIQVAGAMKTADCYGSTDDDGIRVIRGANKATPGRGNYSYGGKGSGYGGLGSRGSGVGGGGAAGARSTRPAPAASPSAAEAAPAPSPRPRPSKTKEKAERKRAPMMDAAQAPAEESVAAEPVAVGGASAKPIDRYEADREDSRMRRPLQPTFDWGAKVYLSNDDSMSLASAQRLLWAVDANRHFTASEVRPHELLNYFSFDTAPVPDGETFSLMGAAEQDGDTLSVALTVQGATPAREALDLTLVVDRSGSMRSEGRMEYVKRGLTTMTENLQPGDRVDLVLFDSDVCTPVQDFVVGRDPASVLTNAIAAMQPRGATNLDAGMREAYRIQTSREEKKRNKRMLLLTDANLNAGNVNESLVAEIGARFDKDDIRVTGIGVGRNFNDRMLNKITEKGKGAYVYLGSEAVVDRVFGSGFDSLVNTIAHDVQFSVKLPPSLAMERFYGEESSTNAADVQPIHYYAGTSQVFLQDLKIKDSNVERNAPLVFTATYEDAATGEPKKATFSTTVGALLDGDRRNLDKAQALMGWTDVLTSYAMSRRCTGTQAVYDLPRTLQGDAEIAYVQKLTGKLCGEAPTMASGGVSFKVVVDSDQVIPEVALECGGSRERSKLSGSDKVARFEGATPGTCEIRLEGSVPLLARVDVPASGGGVRCIVRNGRMQCD